MTAWLAAFLFLQDQPVLALWENPGFSSEEVREELAKRPRFALYADGTVVFRRGLKKYFKVKLDEKAAKPLIQEALDAGLLEMTEKEFPGVKMPPPPDSSSQDLEFRRKEKSNRLTLPHWIHQTEKLFPNDKKMAALKKLRDKLAAFNDESAVPE